MPVDPAVIRDFAVARAAVVTACAAGTTAVVAVRGINKWRDELAGKAHFDCARTVAKCVYQMRQAIQDCRSPLIFANEFPSAKDLLDEQMPQTRAGRLTHIYRARFAKVGSTLTDLDTASLEAEALWGATIQQKIEELRSRVFELNAAVNAFIDNEQAGGRDFATDKDFGARMRAIVSSSGDANGHNEFTERMAVSTKDIELELRPHLHRKE